MESMRNEVEVIKRILAGDKEEFRILVENYQNLVAHIVFRMIPNEADRVEIAQDVFLKAYQNLSKFEFKARFSTWIAKITYNTCINYLKKSKVPLYNDIYNCNEGCRSSKAPEQSTYAGGIDTCADETEQPDAWVIQRQQRKILSQFIEKLPLQQKVILTLFHLDELSYKEISEVLNLPEGTVKSYLFRARKSLKDMLLSEYKTEDVIK